MSETEQKAVTKDKIAADMKAALKAGQKLKLSTLRMLLSAIKYEEIKKREGLSADEITTVVSREIKKRREAIPLYRQGDRPELAEKEEAEAEVLTAYLPQQLTGDELEILVAGAVKESGAVDLKGMGKVMAILMPKTKGRADGAAVSKLVKEALGK